MFARCWCSLSLQQVVDKTMRVHRINFGDPVSHKMISMQSEFAVFTSAQVVTVINKTVSLTMRVKVLSEYHIVLMQLLVLLLLLVCLTHD